MQIVTFVCWCLEQRDLGSRATALEPFTSPELADVLSVCLQGPNLNIYMFLQMRVVLLGAELPCFFFQSSFDGWEH